MAEQKESSVLFNLGELMKLEESRVQEEVAKKDAAEMAVRSAREAEEKRVRDELTSKQKMEDDARLAVERSKRDEEDRRVRDKAEGELRVKLEADARARQTEQERLLAHEAEMKRIESQGKKGMSPLALGGIGAVALGGVAALWFFVAQPQIEAHRTQARVALEAANAARIAGEQARAESAQFARDLQALNEQLVAARAGGNPEQVRAIEAQVAAVRTRTHHRTPRTGGNNAGAADPLGGGHRGGSDDPLGF